MSNAKREREEKGEGWCNPNVKLKKAAQALIKYDSSYHLQRGDSMIARWEQCDVSSHWERPSFIIFPENLAILTVLLYAVGFIVLVRIY